MPERPSGSIAELREAAAGPAPPDGDGRWHALPVEAVAAALGVDPQRGLSFDEARARLERFGRNELEERDRRTWPAMLADQFRDVVVWVLLAATAIAAALGDLTDAAVILAIVALNAVLGVVQEARAERALAALKRMAAPRARVLRGGRILEIPTPEVVPGDIVFLEAGNFVPADVRLLEAVNLRVDESALTGESAPVDKRAQAILDAAVPVEERLNMAFAGTTVVRGRGKGIVTATGYRTELGRIAELLGRIEAEKTPLQERLEALGRWLALLVLVIAAVVFAAGLLRGAPLLDMFLASVSLAVAAVPEGLPAVVTIVLALGVANMARRHVIVRRLRAVEALGSVTLIGADKTGTLTQNEMTVRRFWADGRTGSVTGAGYVPHGAFSHASATIDPFTEPGLRRLLEIAVLCNDARLFEKDGQWEIAGDPTEAALLVAAAKAGIAKEELEQRLPRRLELPFDPDRKRMSTLHEWPAGGYLVAVKGAPDEVLQRSAFLQCGHDVVPLSEADREQVEQVYLNFAEQALRVLGFAYRHLREEPEDLTPEHVERDLIFVGLLGMIDPPRSEVREAIRLCKSAGIRPVMITGDLPITARVIAEELEMLRPGDEVLTGAELREMPDDLLDRRLERAAVFARVSPSDKHRIVRAYQRRGEIVAMTGDGVNDAPALKRSDVGIAMGQRGSDVSREVADLVLQDDNFATIVDAVEEGRGIYENIQKFLRFLFSTNLSEVLVVAGGVVIAVAAGLRDEAGRLLVPLTAAQILWINLLTDGLPAVALAFDHTPGVMQQPPRPAASPLLDRPSVQFVVGVGVMKAALALTLLVVVPMAGYALETARAAAFHFMAVGQLLLIYPSRHTSTLPLTNPYVHAAVLGGVALQVAASSITFVADLLGRAALPLELWAVVSGAALVSWGLAEGISRVVWRAPEQEGA